MLGHATAEDKWDFLQLPYHLAPSGQNLVNRRHRCTRFRDAVTLRLHSSRLSRALAHFVAPLTAYQRPSLERLEVSGDGVLSRDRFRSRLLHVQSQKIPTLDASLNCY